MTILITGATGFLGSRLLVDLLTVRKREVVVLGRGSPAALRSRLLRVLQCVSGQALDSRARARLRCVSGDVTKRWLGLPPALYAQLAQTCEAVWHCAGDIALAGERERLFAVNAQGTSEVLEFASMTVPSCRLVHMSTMAVAGGLRHGVIREDHLSDAHGFETHYDASKFEAERLVRQWAERHRRSAVVLRPSVVTTDREGTDEAPSHPLNMLGQMIDGIARSGAPGIPAPAHSGSRLDLRLPVPADVTFNLVPDRYAIAAMLRIGHDHQHGAGARTFHVVHPVETTMGLLAKAIESRYPGLRITCNDDVTDPTPAERFVAASLPGFLSYRHRRTYDRSNTLALTSDLAEPAPLDRIYLARALAPAVVADADSASASVVTVPA